MVKAWLPNGELGAPNGLGVIAGRTEGAASDPRCYPPGFDQIHFGWESRPCYRRRFGFGFGFVSVFEVMQMEKSPGFQTLEKGSEACEVTKAGLPKRWVSGLVSRSDGFAEKKNGAGRRGSGNGLGLAGTAVGV